VLLTALELLPTPALVPREHKKSPGQIIRAAMCCFALQLVNEVHGKTWPLQTLFRVRSLFSVTLTDSQVTANATNAQHTATGVG